MNEVPVGLQNRADRRASSEEKEIPERVWDRSLPRPVGETGRRSVGNRKEQQNAATMRVPRIGSPTYPISEKLNRTGAEGDAFGSFFVRQQTMPYSY